MRSQGEFVVDKFVSQFEKYACGCLVTLAVVVIGYLFYSSIQKEKDYQIKDAQERQDCVDLDPTYQKLYQVKSGFFKGQIMMAVNSNVYNVVMRPALQTETYHFMCGNLEEVIQ